MLFENCRLTRIWQLVVYLFVFVLACALYFDGQLIPVKESSLIVEPQKLRVMKTSFKSSIAAVALVATFGFVSFSASAQHHDRRNNDNKKEYKYSKKGYSNERNYHADRDYHSKNDRYDNHRHYDARPSNERYYDKRYVYHHPQYGHVHRGFHSTPLRLHYANGDFYYHGGSYYRLQPRVGYVRVEMPANYVFVDLPGNYTRVYVNGGWYYRSGDLYFERCLNGYRLSPNISINFSARF